MADEVDYSGVPSVVLESLRVRLSQLVHSLTALLNRVQTAELPAWPALHQQFNLAILQLSSLVSTLETFHTNLGCAVTYPMPTFPVKTQGWLLTTLLRKKNLPEVDEWIQEGVTAGERVNDGQSREFNDWVLSVLPEGVELEPFEEIKASTPSPGWSMQQTIGYMSGRSNS